VQGPGAEAFTAPSAVGGDAQGDGGKPIVEPQAPAPPRQTTPEEAAVIGKAVAAYCRLGWGELASRNQDALGRFVPSHLQPQVFEGGLSMVEHSATALALKHNVRIPYGDELTVGLGCAIATVGIAGTIKGKASNDNKQPRPQAQAQASAPSANKANKPRPAARDASPIDADHDERNDSDDIPSASSFDPDKVSEEASA
jgi:hypothetical protein